MIGSRRSRTRLRPLLLGSSFAFGVLASLATASAAAGGVTFSVRPANPDPNDSISRAYFRPVATPGTSLTETVAVSDDGDAPAALFVYPVDGLTGVTSGTVYANRSDPRTRAGTWLTASVPSLLLAPHERTTVDVRINVPADATPGDHVAGIAFENARPTTGAGFAITEVIREVIGVQVRVPGPGQFHLRVDGASFVMPPAAAEPSLNLRLGDDGNRLGQSLLLVTLHGPHGFVDSVSRQLDTLLPGDRISYPLGWPRPLPPGDYTVSVAENGSSVADFTGPLVIPPGATPATSPSALQTARPSSPAGAASGVRHQANPTWMRVAAAVAAGGVLILLAGLLLRRRRRTRPIGAHSAMPVSGGWQKSAVGLDR